MAMTREQFTKIQAALLAEGFGIVKLATMPATTTAAAPAKAAAPAADGRATVYTCSVCGQKGHNARHHEKPAATQAKPATPAPAKAAPAKPAPVAATPALDDLDFDVDDFGPAPTKAATPAPTPTPTKAAPAKAATPAAPVEAADAELDTLLSDLL